MDELRRRLQEHGLHRSELHPDPLEQFRRWFDEARDAGVHEVTAMVVSTVGPDGLPSSRHVLLKGLDDGFVFYTNRHSQKGRELAGHPQAALCFPWNQLNRQVRVAGPVELVGDVEGDEYFASRPRDSQIGAWASRQSEVLGDRAELEARYDEVEARYEGAEVPRPPHWGGYRVRPVTVEFWQGRRSRLHDRFRYTPDGSDPSGWRIDRLAP
jgi:pyridoxamine 5'-phosphate oxidase